jgi:16S rRNA (cytosine1402-N4)-methyltransferase
VTILTFHSGEDRRVKKSFKTFEAEGVFSEIARDVVRASPEERRANPRSSSAKLRWARMASGDKI